MKFERLTRENAVALIRPLVGSEVSVLMSTDGTGKTFTVLDGKFRIRGRKDLATEDLETNDIYFVMRSPKIITLLDEMLSHSEIRIYPLLKNEYYHWIHEAVLAKIKEDEDEQKRVAEDKA